MASKRALQFLALRTSHTILRSQCAVPQHITSYTHFRVPIAARPRVAIGQRRWQSAAAPEAKSSKVYEFEEVRKAPLSRSRDVQLNASLLLLRSKNSHNPPRPPPPPPPRCSSTSANRTNITPHTSPLQSTSRSLPSPTLCSSRPRTLRIGLGSRNRMLRGRWCFIVRRALGVGLRRT